MDASGVHARLFKNVKRVKRREVAFDIFDIFE